MEVDHEDVRIGPTAMPGMLDHVAHAKGLVLFAHGSGSSRHSPRNRMVAEVLQRRSLATLLFDLLSPEEASDRARVFDIDLLASRLGQALDWVRTRADLQRHAVGLFGASTGAAAALQAAARWPGRVAAVVSRGGRPDLAGDWLAAVRAPCLLICGGLDVDVLDLNRQAVAALTGIKRLEIVPGATHLFAEPGALDAVAQLAAGWFQHYLDITPPR